MPSPEVWGPPIWTLFHVLAERIKEDTFNVAFPPLIEFIKKICAFLPCPDCAQHATQFMSTVRIPPTKEDCKKMLFYFHNSVNKNLKKPLYNYDDMTMYQRVNLLVCYKLFREQFTKKTNNLN